MPFVWAIAMVFDGTYTGTVRWCSSECLTMVCCGVLLLTLLLILVQGIFCNTPALYATGVEKYVPVCVCERERAYVSFCVCVRELAFPPENSCGSYERPRHVHICQKRFVAQKKAPAAATTYLKRLIFSKDVSADKNACGRYDRLQKSAFLKLWSLTVGHSSVS